MVCTRSFGSVCLCFVALILVSPISAQQSASLPISGSAIVADHHTALLFESISGDEVSAAAAIPLMFRHASVGGTVDDGLDCLQGTRNNPEPCTVYQDYRYDRRNWNFQPRGNSGWYGKVDDFVAETERQKDSFDIFSFKYCYLDGLDGLGVPCGKTFDPVRTGQAWEYLRDNMEMLETKYPGKIFIWWSIPLTQSGQYCTDTLNSLIRSYCRDNGKILFDIADIESHDPQGQAIRNDGGLEVAYKGYCGEQQPGAQACHPNWDGKVLLARAFWWLISEIAIRRTTAVEPVPGTPAATVFNYPNPFEKSTSIRLAYPLGPYTLFVYDVLGRLKRRQRGVGDGGTDPNSISFRRESLLPGIYWYSIHTGDRVFTGKFLVR